MRKNNLVFVITIVLICCLIFFINLEILKLSKPLGYISSGIMFGVILFIINKPTKFLNNKS